MSAQELSAKYIIAMEKTVNSMQRTQGTISASEERINELLGYVMAYLKDAKYFWEQKKFETSLTSIAYCEGLLDALKIIGAINIPVGP